MGAAEKSKAVKQRLAYERTVKDLEAVPAADRTVRQLETLARAYNRLGRYSDAAGLLLGLAAPEEAVPIGWGEWHCQLGYALYQLGRYEEALPFLKNSVYRPFSPNKYSAVYYKLSKDCEQRLARLSLLQPDRRPNRCSEQLINLLGGEVFLPAEDRSALVRAYLNAYKAGKENNFTPIILPAEEALVGLAKVGTGKSRDWQKSGPALRRAYRTRFPSRRWKKTRTPKIMG